jgi:TRAP-type C4-dicarboxylate transport system substrate-binding protein
MTYATRRLVIGGVPALALGRPARAAASYTMKLTTTAANDLDTEWLDLFKRGVEAASHGAIAANIYPSSQLGSGPATTEGVAMGTIEVALNASGTYEGVDPRFAVFSVPGLISSMQQGAKLLADPAVRRQLSTIGRDKGFEILTAMAHSPTGIVSRRPIRALADFKGMKIRVPGSALLVAQLQKLGASPIAMSLGEVLPAFQNGTIDGVYAGSTIFTALKYYDIAKNLTLLPGTFIVMVGIINSDFLQSLGKLADVVSQAAHTADVEGATWGEGDVRNAQAIWEKNGGQTLSLPPADAAAFLDAVIPTAIANLTPAAKADYEVLKAAAGKA